MSCSLAGFEPTSIRKTVSRDKGDRKRSETSKESSKAVKG